MSAVCLQKNPFQVGLTETTSKVQKYELEDNPLIQLYDLPGNKIN